MVIRIYEVTDVKKKYEEVSNFCTENAKKAVSILSKYIIKERDLKREIFLDDNIPEEDLDIIIKEMDEEVVNTNYEYELVR